MEGEARQSPKSAKGEGQGKGNGMAPGKEYLRANSQQNVMDPSLQAKGKGPIGKEPRKEKKSHVGEAMAVLKSPPSI